MLAFTDFNSVFFVFICAVLTDCLYIGKALKGQDNPVLSELLSSTPRLIPNL